MTQIRGQQNNFDGRMNKMGEGVTELKNLTVNQNQEAKRQLKMTEKINERVEKTDAKMKKIDSRLDKFVVNSSDCKVWLYIVAQIVILMALIIIS
mmetsp:Transcript_11352/g.19127  ORF Transcript_11352/g.19127 Transcript_11352/m.19127 type:complete len:95 (+) Transcript_11352:437-721(+)